MAEAAHARRGWRRPYPRLAQLIDAAVVALAGAALGWLLLTSSYQWPDTSLFLALMACGTLTSLGQRWLGEPERRPGEAEVDLQSVWIFTSVLLLPPVYAALAPLALEPSARQASNGGWGRVANAACFVLAAAAADTVSQLISDTSQPLLGAATQIDQPRLAAALAAAVVTFVAVNAGTVAECLRWQSGAPRLASLGGFAGLVTEGGVQCTGVLVAAAWAQGSAPALLTLPALILLQRSLLHTELLQAARTDAKTGLANASYWQRLCTDRLRRAARSGTPVAIALVDLDHFKRINDRFGHLLGDEALRAVADALGATSRADDVACRFGGEEFAVLLPDTTRQDALDIAERLREAVATTGFLPEATEAARLTASVGLAHSDDYGWDAEGLLRAADVALYDAKARGRDRVTVAGGIPREAAAAT